MTATSHNILSSTFQNSNDMQDHQHTIGEVFNLQEKLDAKAGKNHTHEQYAEKEHTHNYAAKSHTHKSYAAADHSHEQYAAKDHTHDFPVPTRQPQAAIVLQDGGSLDIDAFNTGEMVQVICTNTDKVVHIKDYFKSELPRKFNCQNIVIAPHKSFAARIYRTDLQAFILFDGILFE